MKQTLCYLSTLALLSASALAGPLEKTQIAADAKWLLHLDLDNLRGSEFGRFMTKHLTALADVKSDHKIDFSAIFQKLGHITAYGDQFDMGGNVDGVMLLKMDGETRKILEGFLASQILADKDGSIKKVQQESSTLYSMKDELFLSIQSDHLVVVSKSRQRIDKAKEVLAGKAVNLTSGKAFAGFPAAPNTFFFLGVAEAFNQNAAMPPQAKILQKAEGGRLVVGEKADKLFADVILKAKSPDVITEIRQVVEGMRALVSLSLAENPELQELARSINVSSKDTMLQLNFEYPTAKVLEKLGPALEQGQKKGERKQSAKLEKKQKVDNTSKEEAKPSTTE